MKTHFYVYLSPCNATLYSFLVPLVTNLLFVYPLKYCLLQYELRKYLPYKYISHRKTHTSYTFPHIISRSANSPPHWTGRFCRFGSVLAISSSGQIILLLSSNFQWLSISFVFCDSRLFKKIPLKYVCLHM